MKNAHTWKSYVKYNTFRVLVFVFECQGTLNTWCTFFAWHFQEILSFCPYSPDHIWCHRCNGRCEVLKLRTFSEQATFSM